MTKKIERFADIDDRWEDIDEWVKMEDFLEKDICVQDVREVTGTYGKYCLVKFTTDVELVDERTGDSRLVNYGFSTGAKVLMKRLMYAKENGLLPLVGAIRKYKHYYVIE